jgi:V/A-type H+-transporting ATPase subunit C
VPLEALQDLVAVAISEASDGDATSAGTERVPEALRGAAHQAVQAFRASGDPQVIDLVVDRAAQDYYLETAAKYKAQFLTGYLARLADLTNLRSYLRVSRMGRDDRFLRSVLLPGGTVPTETFTLALEGPVEAVMGVFSGTIYAQLAQEGLRSAEETGRLTKLEALTWDFLMKYLRGAKHIHFGFPAVWAYVMAKEAETRLLRFIFVGKLNGLSRDKIAERLFDTYV